jgi:hypothetical protein
MNLGSRFKSLSFCFLLNTQDANNRAKRMELNKATAKEKSMLIISLLPRGKVNLDGLPVRGHKAFLLDKEIMPDITHTQKINLQIA